MTLISFPFYIADWRDSSARRRLNVTEKICYMELFIFCWADGFLPTEESELIAISGLDRREFRAAWKRVQEQFYLQDGVYRHHKIDEKRPGLEGWREARVDAGKKGGRATAIAKARAKAIASASEQLYRKPSSSSSSSSSGSGGEEHLGLEEATVFPPPEAPPPQDEDWPPAAREIAGMLTEFAPHLGTPDERLCLKLLRFAGDDPARIEAWLVSKAAKRREMKSWSWFSDVGEVDLRQARVTPISPPPQSNSSPPTNLFNPDRDLPAADIAELTAKLAEAKAF